MPTQNIFDLLDTWASGGGPYTSIKMNATDNDVGSASLLMDLQVGAASKFSVSKAGIIRAVGTTATLTMNDTVGSVLAYGTSQVAMAGGQLDVTGSNLALRYSANAFGFGNDQSVGWRSGAISTFIDLFLTRRGAANLRFGAADVGATTATVTITIAAPGVVTWSNHGFGTGTPVVFTTTGALPTGITSGTTYYAVVIDANTFQLASSVANAIAATPTVITTSGSQSGTHTGTRYNITQRLSMQSITGVTDRLGADLLIQGSQGTGTGTGGSIIFQVAPAGSTGTAQNGLVPALTIASDRTTTLTGALALLVSGGDPTSHTISTNDAGYLTFARGGNVGLALYEPLGHVQTRSDGHFGWTPSSSPWSTVDLKLSRDAANTLALRNGTNAQAFRVYNTWTSFGSGTEIWERGNIFWDGNILKIGTEKGANGGTARMLDFQTDGITRIQIQANGSVDVKNNLNVGGGGLLYWLGRAVLSSPSDGVVQLMNNNLLGGFGRLQFGGGSSSFPALKVVSANLQVIAADGTSSAGLIVGNQALSTTATDGFLYVPTCAGTPTGTPTTQTGTVPIIVDTTNYKLYFYSGAAWRDAGP